MKNKQTFVLASVFLVLMFAVVFSQTAQAAIYSPLTIGSRGAQVTELQQTLTNLGFYSGPISGYFGGLTKAAVVKFQITNNVVPAIGYFGSLSRAKLNQLAQGKSATQPPVTTISAQNQSTTFQLQSEFLKNELIAQQIASGQMNTYDIKNYGFILGATSPNANREDFAYRFISGIRMTGQIIGRNTVGGTYPSEGLLNKFQLYWGIPVSPNIDAVVLKKLDAILASRETNEKTLAISFPLYDHFIDAPKNQETKTHVAYLFAQVFKELPSSIVVWSEQNFKDYFSLQLKGHYSNLDSSDYKICDTFLYDGVGDGCVSITGYPKVLDDFDTMNTKIHEYAHYLDRNLYSRNQSTSQGVIDTTGFYSISFDLSNSGPSTFGKAYALKNPSNYKNELVSSYARGWGGVQTDGVTRFSPYEDFAESFAMYVVQGKVFRKLSETNTILSQKYNWLKQNVFNGQEYQSGDIAGIATIKARPTGSFDEIATGAFNIRDYTQSLPDFVWNYQFLNGSKATK